MQVSVIKIGNSRGIRIPKTVLDRYQLDGQIELELKDDGIMLRPTSAVREGWGAAFQQAASTPDEGQVFPDFFPEDDQLLDELIGDDLIKI